MKSIAIAFKSVLVVFTLPLRVAVADDPGSDYPSKMIKIIVPYVAGGSVDALARTVSAQLQQRLGQSVIVENKPGGGSNIGALYVAKSPADGYTLFFGTSAALAVNQHLYKSPQYDPQKDFAPVVLATTQPSVVVVNNSLPVKTMKELNQYLLSHPGEVNYASSGNGTPAHLGTEMYKTMTGIKMTHVPYKGGAPAIADLVGGHTSLMFAILPEVMPFIKDGKLRGLAVTTAKRSSLLPDLPTVAETGVPNYDVTAWYAVVVPTGTPKAIVTKLNKAINGVLEEKETRDKLTNMGFEIVGGPPERLTEQMRTESAKWKQVIIDARVQVD